MINIFHRKEQQNNGSTVQTIQNVSGQAVQNVQNADANMQMLKNHLAPPKSLPDLAKDIFSGAQRKDEHGNAPVNNIRELGDEQQGLLNDHIPSFPEAQVHNTPIPSEPSKSTSIPRLDINLLRNKNLMHPSDTLIQESKSSNSQDVNTISNGANYVDESIYNTSNQHIASNLHIPITDARFGQKSLFADIEEYYKKNPKMNADVYFKEILERLYAYHHDFSLSSVASRFSELKDLEHLWARNKERIDSIVNASKDMEAEMLFKSDELRRVIDNHGVLPSSNLLREGVSQVFNQPIVARKIMPDFFNALRPQKGDSSKSGEDFMAHQNDAMHVPVDSHDFGSFSELTIYDPTKYFYVSDGLVLKSLSDLGNALTRMRDDTFYNHVNSSKNDFANWIEEVFNLSVMANAVRSIRTRQELLSFMVSNRIL